MPIPRKKKIGGRIYYYFHWYSSKRDAKEVADRMRKRGYNARVLRYKASITREPLYVVFVKPKRG